MEVDAKTLVIGDLCIIKAGDRIPADIRLIFANSLKVCISLESVGSYAVLGRQLVAHRRS